jgi:hypothetical protein
LAISPSTAGTNFDRNRGTRNRFVGQTDKATSTSTGTNVRPTSTTTTNYKDIDRLHARRHGPTHYRDGVY